MGEAAHLWSMDPWSVEPQGLHLHYIGMLTRQPTASVVMLLGRTLCSSCTQTVCMAHTLDKLL